MRTGRRPNVLIVLWDTVRADRMSAYGYARPTTPRIAAWAERAAVFERASSPGIWTLPAHASMFTGLPPQAHGADERWMWLDQRFVTMAEHFSAAGYATYALAANALLCGETNLVKGFGVRLNTYRGKLATPAARMTRRKVPPGDRSNELAPGWRPPAHGAHNAEWARASYKDAAPLAVKAFGRWLVEQPRDQPFFAYLNLMEAHTPRIPTMRSRERVLAADPGPHPPGPRDGRGPHQPALLQLRQARLQRRPARRHQRRVRRDPRRSGRGHGRPARQARGSWLPRRHHRRPDLRPRREPRGSPPVQPPVLPVGHAGADSPG